MRITERVDAVKLISRSDAWTVGLPINYAGFHADRLSHLFAVRKGRTDLKAANISTALRDSGPMPSTGCISTAACHKNFSTCA